jgi:dTMP kinase
VDAGDRRGLLVAVTGVDGAGKTTAVGGVVQMLREAGRSAVPLKIPLFDNVAFQRYRPVIGVLAARHPEARAAAAASMILLETVRFVHEDVEPALQGHEVVVLDRYVESTRCYLDERSLPAQHFDAVVTDLPAADLHVHLHLDVEVAIARLRGLGEPVDTDKARFLTGMNRRLQEVAERSGAIIIDATRPRRVVSREVAAAVLAALASRPVARAGAAVAPR